MIETEAKIKLTEIEFKKFICLFNRPNFIDQENIIYLISGGFLRIRRENDKKIITLKKSAEGEFNSRKEIEFETNSNLRNLKEFFKELNFQQTLTYRKRRANIRRDQCTISLDILPKDNYYIEIEGKPEKIKQIIKEFNLQNHRLETKSYFELFISPTPSPVFQPAQPESSQSCPQFPRPREYAH